MLDGSDVTESGTVGGCRAMWFALLATLASACVAHSEAEKPARANRPATAIASRDAADASWTKIEMNWQSVVYLEAGRGILFEIEPMFDVPDIVYVPDAEAWSKSAPPWARERRDEILAQIKKPVWHRELEWRESNKFGVSTNLRPVPGSIESTAGGREIQNKRLFDPNSELTAAQARMIWQILVRRFAMAARGEVNLFVGGSPERSVFRKVTLPALEANPNVKIVWHGVASGAEP